MPAGCNKPYGHRRSFVLQWQYLNETGGYDMTKWAVIYSSVTGNTRQIAEAIAQKADDADIFRVESIGI